MSEAVSKLEEMYMCFVIMLVSLDDFFRCVVSWLVVVSDVC